jgi:hypothetical protein
LKKELNKAEQLPNDILWLDLFEMSYQEIIFDKTQRRKCKKKLKLTDMAAEGILKSSSKELVTGVGSVMQFAKGEDSEKSSIKGFIIKLKNETYFLPKKSNLLLEKVDHFIYLKDTGKSLHITLPDDQEILKIIYTDQKFSIFKYNDSFSFNICSDKNISKLQLPIDPKLLQLKRMKQQK